MREYEDETSDVTGRDVWCAWLVVATVLSAMFVLGFLLEILRA